MLILNENSNIIIIEFQIRSKVNCYDENKPISFAVNKNK